MRILEGFSPYDSLRSDVWRATPYHIHHIPTPMIIIEYDVFKKAFLPTIHLDFCAVFHVIAEHVFRENVADLPGDCGVLKVTDLALVR